MNGLNCTDHFEFCKSKKLGLITRINCKPSLLGLIAISTRSLLGQLNFGITYQVM